MNRLLPILLFSLFANCTFAQLGGEKVYGFLNTSQSARVTALGEYLISVKDGDGALGYSNPALLNKEMDKFVSFNHVFHFGGISHGYVNYVKDFSNLGLTFHGGIKYIQYGDFQAADVTGTVSGNFKANELALVVGAAKQLNERFSIGSNLKLINSRFESYSSFGVALDIASHFYNPEKQLGFSFLIKNVGAQLSTYTGERSEIAFDVQFGISKRLAHLPFRFSVTAHDLHRWNLRFDNPNINNDDLLFEEESDPSAFSVGVDNFFRHLVMSGEFILGKKEVFMIRFAYNHQRKQELAVQNIRSLAGFSYGFGIKLKKIRLDYGHSRYHVAGGVHHIGLSTNFQKLSSNL